MENHGNGGTTPLRELRLQRGMTQQEVAEALERLAWVQNTRRVGVNADMVSKWERGEKSPSRFYLRLLCSLFEMTAAQLGYGSAVAASDAATSLRPGDAGAVTCELVQASEVLDGSSTVVELLKPKMFELWRNDLLSRRQMLKLMGVAPAVAGLDAIETTLSVLPSARAAEFRGQETLTQLEELAGRLESLYHSSDPRRLLLPVRALIGTVEEFIPDARKREVRQALLGIVARAHLLAGRLSFFDLHDSLPARAHLDLAREAAQEAAVPALTSVVFGHIAFLSAEKRNYPAAASYISAARDALTRQPLSPVSSWLSAIEAEMNTQAGVMGPALRCLDRARDELPGWVVAPFPVWFDFFDERRLNGFEGFTLRRAGDLTSARSHLQAALAPGPQVTPKQRSVSMIDLAVTCVEDGDLDEGCRLATEAATVLHRAGYATAVNRLTEFQGTLPDARHPAARLLRESIAELS
jgi:transcriptional regulator with XRE-family HTH domain